MASMHAVEVADGKGDAIVAGLGKSANDLHAAVSGGAAPGNNRKALINLNFTLRDGSRSSAALRAAAFLQSRNPFAPTWHQREVESHPDRTRIDLAHHLRIGFQLRAIALPLAVQKCSCVSAFVAR